MAGRTISAHGKAFIEIGCKTVYPLGRSLFTSEYAPFIFGDLLAIGLYLTDLFHHASPVGVAT